VEGILSLQLICQHHIIFLSLPSLYGPCSTLVSFRINLQVSLSLTICLQSLTPISFGLVWKSPTHTLHLTVHKLSFRSVWKSPTHTLHLTVHKLLLTTHVQKLKLYLKHFLFKKCVLHSDQTRRWITEESRFGFRLRQGNSSAKPSRGLNGKRGYFRGWRSRNRKLVSQLNLKPK
jgi:hypothetical protein